VKKTPLYPCHVALKAKMAEFAGYDMPIQYPDGVMAEHHWTRAHAGIFDVSHMGQWLVEGSDAAQLFEHLTPSSFSTVPVGTAKYTVLMNNQGGIIDDMIVTRIAEDRFFVVVNAGCKDKDLAWVQSHLTPNVRLRVLAEQALIAVQGPKAEHVLREALDIDTASLSYMRWMDYGRCMISRLGYTGEDGFEISMPAEDAEIAWNRLLKHSESKPVGLGARDSLRLEMGYPLYGHDIDDTTSPLEARIGWIMGKRQDADFVGGARITQEKASGLKRARAGLILTAPGVAREGANIFSEDGQTKIGIVTSGGFSPTLNAAIAMGYIDTDFTKEGTGILARVRGRDIPARITALPFVQPKTKILPKKVA
jgi:aminomethyltransferase